MTTAIGLIIRAQRKRKGWTQAELAEKAGVSQATISMIERGGYGKLTVGLLGNILKALDRQLYVGDLK